jgi:hypothetical protein
MLVTVHVIAERLVRDLHFTVIEVGEVKRASAYSLSVTSNCTLSKTEGALPSISAYLTTLVSRIINTRVIR